ncbi:MAG: cell division protein ZapA [Gammaproteobacteria bacterium]|nr:cell division protein ZapA [Gammaproteobacteria bacterium]
MSNETAKAIPVSILGKDYMVACPEGERTELLASANYLDKKMREIRDAGKVIGTDRIAVMAALNIAHELLHQKAGPVTNVSNEVEGRIRNLQTKIEDALFRSRQLEF